MGHAIPCAERVVGNEPFAVLLAVDFLVQPTVSAKSNVTEDLRNAFEISGQTQISIMQVAGLNFSKYGVIVKGDTSGAVASIVEKPKLKEAPADIASIGL